MNRKQYNLITCLTEHVDPDNRSRLLAFADATLDQDFSYNPKEPIKSVPYQDQRAFIDAVVAADRTRDVSKALSICEKYGL